MEHVAVIGAGISGLTAARSLRDHGIPVTVFDKGRGVSGRMSTRRAEHGLRFDHGAQYFTVRDRRFEQSVQSWIADGIVARWNGRVGVIESGQLLPSQREHERYVGVPAMNAVCKHLTRDLKVHVSTRLAALERRDGRWALHDDGGKALGEFEWVIVSAPAPQAAELLDRAAPQLTAKTRAVPMQSCWAAMAGFDQALPLPLDGAFVHNSSLAWVARNSSKPDRSTNQECWILHANPQWSEDHQGDDKESVAATLLSEFWRATKLSEIEPNHLAAHRWRFAIAPNPLDDRCLTDPKLKAAVCGDWCYGARVEGAFLSGMAAANKCYGDLGQVTT